ncbi:MAG: TRAP transporter TatT component family protein, partial [Acidobacteriota bacterium]
MKHKKIYTETTGLIKLREEKKIHLDDAEATLTKLIKKDPECDWAYGLLAQIYYWRGEVAESKDRIKFYQRGVEYGEQGVAVNSENLESNFWLAVDYGLLGQERGILESLRLIDPIEKHAEKALKLDESYFYGGPLRLLGRFYNQLPGWPISRGDNKKALQYLQKALHYGPKFYLNHLYIADIYITLKDKEKAREHLQWVIKAPPSPHHEQEDSRYKQA